jgi:hypothetical protein
MPHFRAFLLESPLDVRAGAGRAGLSHTPEPRRAVDKLFLFERSRDKSGETTETSAESQPNRN